MKKTEKTKRFFFTGKNAFRKKAFNPGNIFNLLTKGGINCKRNFFNAVHFYKAIHTTY